MSLHLLLPPGILLCTVEVCFSSYMYEPFTKTFSITVTANIPIVIKNKLPIPKL